MTDKAISPLRRRMIEDMTIRKFAPKTQQGYMQSQGLRCVSRPITRHCQLQGRYAAFSCIWRRTAHTRQDQSHRIGAAVLFRCDARSTDIAEHASFVHEPRKLPVVFSPEEVARLLEAAPGVKYKAALSVAYGAGLRVSEVVSLKVSDIDTQAHDDARRAGQGAQGSLRDAVSTSARTFARLVCMPHGRRAGCFPARTR